MRAVWIHEFGGPEHLVPGTAPDPAPEPGQVLIDVVHANITFVETQFRATGFGPSGATLPVIPGNGVGGLISGVGPGVDPGLVGRRVVSGIGAESAAERGVALVRPTPTPALLRAYTERALAEGAAGRLRPVIGQRFPLARAAEAHAAIEARSTVGKTLLDVR